MNSIPVVVNRDVSLLDYPIKRQAPSKTDEITVGDLHGNALKFINFLITEGILELENAHADYAELTQIYLSQTRTPCLHKLANGDSVNAFTGPPKMGLVTRESLLKFIRILWRANFNAPNVIRLIGDELGDRGHNDLFTLLIIHVLVIKKVPIKICLSNHSLISIKALLKLFKNQKLIKYRRRLLPGQENSLQGLFDLLSNDTVSIKEIQALFYSSYLNCLCLVDYSFDKNSDLYLFSHAPIDLTRFKKAINYLNEYINEPILVSFSSPKALAKSIDKINTAVLTLLKEGRYLSLFEYHPRNYFSLIYWARDLVHNPRFHFDSGHQMTNLHGHIGGNNYINHNNLINLDCDLGKEPEYSSSGVLISVQNKGLLKVAIQLQISPLFRIKSSAAAAIVRLRVTTNAALESWPEFLAFFLKTMQANIEKSYQSIIQNEFHTPSIKQRTFQRLANILTIANSLSTLNYLPTRQELSYLWQLLQNSLLPDKNVFLELLEKNDQKLLSFISETKALFVYNTSEKCLFLAAENDKKQLELKTTAKQLFAHFSLNEQRFLNVISNYLTDLTPLTQEVTSQFYKTHLSQRGFLDATQQLLQNLVRVAKNQKPHSSNGPISLFLTMIEKVESMTRRDSKQTHKKAKDMLSLYQVELFEHLYTEFQALAPSSKHLLIEKLVKQFKTLFYCEQEQDWLNICLSHHNHQSLTPTQRRTHLIISMNTLLNSARCKKGGHTLLSQEIIFWNEQGGLCYGNSRASCEKLIPKTVSSLGKRLIGQNDARDFLAPQGVSFQGFWHRKPLTNMLIKAKKELEREQSSLSL